MITDRRESSYGYVLKFVVFVTCLSAMSTFSPILAGLAAVICPLIWFAFLTEDFDGDLPRYPRIWALFPILLPRSIRDRVYEPAHQELLEDYLLARRRFRTKWAGRWITFSFTIKTAIMVGQSLNAWLGDKARKALKWIAILLLGSEGIKGLRGLLLELLRRM